MVQLATSPSTRHYVEVAVLVGYIIFDGYGVFPTNHFIGIFSVVLLVWILLFPEMVVWRWITFIIVSAVLSTSLYIYLGPTPPAPPLIGWLQPANDPTPDNGCGPSIDPDSVLLIVGGSGFVLSPRFSHVNAVTLGSCKTITMTLGDNGLSLSSDLYDNAGLPIGTLIDNRYTVNANAKLITQVSSDLSTLVIHSDDGDELLYVRYLNPKSIIIRGILSCPSPRLLSVKITNTAVKWGNSNSDGGDCSDGSLNGLVLQ